MQIAGAGPKHAPLILGTLLALMVSGDEPEGGERAPASPNVPA